MRLMRAATLLVVSLTGASCDESLSDLTGPTPNLEPTFSAISRDIFESTDGSGRLACVQCHTDQGRTPAANLNLRSGAAYAQLVGVASIQKPELRRVEPGDPENS